MNLRKWPYFTDLVGIYFIKTGTPWEDKFHELGQWWRQAYTPHNPGDEAYYKNKAERRAQEHNTKSRYLAPTGESYLKEDCTTDDKFNMDCWIVAPESYIVEISAPKFNEWGEIGP